MEATLEIIKAGLFSADGGEPWLLSLGAAEVASAWARCEDGRTLQHVAVVAGERVTAVRAAMACVRGASTYERLYCGPYPAINEAIQEVEAWLDDPSVDRRDALRRHASEAASWARWVSGSACAHAITDVIQLTSAVVTEQLRWAPTLAANAVDSSADAMVDDALRFEGAPEGSAVEARLKTRALAYLTQVVREHLPCPPCSALELRERWLAGWARRQG